MGIFGNKKEDNIEKNKIVEETVEEDTNWAVLTNYINDEDSSESDDDYTDLTEETAKRIFNDLKVAIENKQNYVTIKLNDTDVKLIILSNIIGKIDSIILQYNG